MNYPLWDELWEYTGDGHGYGRGLCAIYTVTILESHNFRRWVA